MSILSEGYSCSIGIIPSRALKLNSSSLKLKSGLLLCLFYSRLGVFEGWPLTNDDWLDCGQYSSQLSRRNSIRASSTEEDSSALRMLEVILEIVYSSLSSGPNFIGFSIFFDFYLSELVGLSILLALRIVSAELKLTWKDVFNILLSIPFEEPVIVGLEDFGWMAT